MNRNLQTFNEAKDKVKIGYFADLGHDIRGVAHIGAHNGYEIEFYFKMGIENVLAFEPLSSAYKALFDKFPKEILTEKLVVFPKALGMVKRPDAVLAVASGDGQSSGFLPLKEGIDKSKPYYQEMVGSEVVEMTTYSDLIREEKIDNRKYDCLVMDVQGMELEVLEGMGKYIRDFKYLNIECSREPIYEGEAPASDIIGYLKQFGFEQLTPVEEHNDILFIRKDLIP